ncbi:MAG: S41 family peptidase [Acidobacteriota bacterium]|nr:S41 family peptidase [Acidobacteriota bacterium]
MKPSVNIAWPRLSVVVLLACLFGLDAPAQQQLTPDQFASDFDLAWTKLRDDYAYFGKKQTDWRRVRELYRPELARVKGKADFVALLERVLGELYDDHAGLSVNTRTSPRLVPTGLDVWAEWRAGRAVVTQLRRGFSAEQAGLRVRMEIVSVNGVPVAEAAARRLPKSLRRADEDSRNWALRAVLAGTHDLPRTIVAKRPRGPATVYRLDLPTHTTVDAYRYEPRVEWKALPRGIGYVKINDLISTEIVAQFDAALEGLKESRGLILDLRDIPRGGNTDVAEPIMGRFIDHTSGYQQVVPLRGPAYVKRVSPRGRWTYRAPVVVLVNRWTASMGEGTAIGLDGMRRATVVGTRMAGLNGGVFTLELPNTKIAINYPGERLNHIDGTPRENFSPPVLVNLADRRLSRFPDPIFEIGRRTLQKLIDSHSRSAHNPRAHPALRHG